MKQIVGNVIKNLGQIGGEVITESVEQVGKIGETIISGKELLGDIEPMSGGEMQRKKMEDEQKKKTEETHLRQGFGGQGRNLEEEIGEVRKEREKKEKEEEEKILREIQVKREEERREHAKMASEMDLTPASKRKKEKGSILSPKKKISQDLTSQTGEYISKVG